MVVGIVEWCWGEWSGDEESGVVMVSVEWGESGVGGEWSGS